jgi:predicted transcriptional regulator of viral defense system
VAPVAASGRTPAPRGQTQAKVLAALRAAPGSTTAAVATAAGIPANTAAATVSRLVKQGRVRRLDDGGYAPVETPAGAAQMGAAPATDAAAASDTPGAQAPATPETQTAR